MSRATRLPGITLRYGKEEPLKRFHPWVFSGAIDKVEGKVEEGDTVEVFSANGEYLGTGHACAGSIAVKIFSFKQQPVDQEFWNAKIREAYVLRKTLGLADSNETNAYRLVFAEGDGLPGLVIDYLNGTCVLQAHSVGMHLAIPEITEALKRVYGSQLKSVYSKSSEALSKMADYETIDGYILGESYDPVIQENDLKFRIDMFAGQKTGYFLDQRENRKLLMQYSKGRRMLDMFCYSGSFAMYALKAGATSVVGIDSSRQAVNLSLENARLNGFEKKYQGVAEDVKHYLENLTDRYDLMVLDPPAFAKHQSLRQQAMKGYRSINAQAIQKMSPGGILFTFSCSQAVDRDSFESAVMAAAVDAGRPARVLHHLSQPPDHPVSIYHPEGEYLKGLVLYIG